VTRTNANDRPTLAPAVKTVLGQLRRRIRQYVWLEGCAGAVVWLGIAFWVTLTADWFFEPPAMVRGIAILAIVVGLVVVVAQLIGRRVFVRITDGNAAMILERRFPQLGDSLLTAVTLAQSPLSRRERARVRAASVADGNTLQPSPPAPIPEGEGSYLYRDMLERTSGEAAVRIRNIDLRQVFNPQPLWLKFCAGGLLALSVALFAVVFPSELMVWARRTLALSDELWPRSTRLEVAGFADGIQKVARGADIEVVARADAAMPVLPQVVEVRYRTQGGGRGRGTMDRRGVARGPEDRFQEYAYTFRSVLADVRFDVVGGDDRISDLWIQAVDSPTISQMALDCELPAYIGRRQRTLPVSGVMQVPQGSRVTVRAGAANKDLVRVEVGSLAEDRTAPVVGQVGNLSHRADEATLTADRRGFSYTLPPLAKGVTLLFTLTDTDGIRGRDPVRLVLTPVPDQPPQIAVQLDGIGTAVTTRARIPAAGRITDDYGLARAWFDYAVDQQRQGRHVIREFPGDAADATTEYPLADAVLELQELGLKPGQKLSLSLRAADLCELGRGPNISASERWTLDVVTPEQLRTMLEARELVLRQRFDRMIQEMIETRDLLSRLEFGPAEVKPRSSAAPNTLGRELHSRPAGEAGGGSTTATPTPPSAASPGDDEPGDSPARQRALRLLRVEGSLTNCRKSAQEVLGMAEAFDDIRKQLVNNRIDTEELKSRLQGGIAEPLRAIAAAMLPELERRLEGLQAVLDDAAKGPGVRDHARQQADKIVLAMQKVRDRMIELEDFNEALDLLRGIIKAQEQIRQQTHERHKQKIRELLKE
jgi:hypothetical protein